MARYIDAEALLELINEDCKYKNATSEYTRGCNEVCDWAIITIKNMPTADVVPASEVEALKDDNKFLQDRRFKEWSEVKQEVAREIFEEIETSLLIGGFVAGEKYYAIREDDYNHYKKKYTESEGK